MPSAILIHPAVWPQQTWAENLGGSVPFFGEGNRGPHLTWSRLGRGPPQYIKWHLDLCSHLSATDMGQKLGVRGCAPLREGSWVPI